MKYYIQDKKSNYKETIEEIITTTKQSIFNFFNSPQVDLNFNIYIYDSIESLVNGLRLRGFKDTPSYMCACQKDEDNSLNFFEPKNNPSNDEWSKEEYKNVIFHELIHGIAYTLFGLQPEWLNEGIAKYLDGTYNDGIELLLEERINIQPIPPQYEIEHEFGEHLYNSYDYAYLMVSYIIEIYGKDYLIELMKDNNKLNEVLNNLLITSIDYYNNKYNKNKLSI